MILEHKLFVSFLLIFLTIVVYIISKKIFLKYHQIYLMPVVISPLLIILILYLGSISLEIYNQAVQPLIWFLGPAVSAFAIPIYQQRKIIVKNGLVLSLGVIVGIIVTIASTILLSKIFSISSIIERSMLSHAVSSPFAITVASYINGGENLAAVFSILTGILGVLIGEGLLIILKIKNSIARGMMYGTTSSVIGTAKAMEAGQEDGVIASLAMVLSGIIMILIAPVLGWILN